MMAVIFGKIESEKFCCWIFLFCQDSILKKFLCVFFGRNEEGGCKIRNLMIACIFCCHL